LDAYYGGNMINYRIWAQIKDMVPSVSIALLMGVLTWLVDTYVLKQASFSDLSRLILCGVFYYIFYLGSCYLLKLSAPTDFKKLVLKG
jgi:hypothetical protein